MAPSAFKKHAHDGTRDQCDENGKNSVSQAPVRSEIIDQPGKSDLIDPKAAR
jgi:hypothetical protein